MITRDEAANIAKARAEEKGWGLLEPLFIDARKGWNFKLKYYNVTSDPRMRGTACRFTIDAETGSILDEGYIPY